MNCNEAKLNFQLLIDDELEEEKITPLIEHIKTCNNCCNEYIALLKLRKKLNGIKGGAQGEKWIEALEHAKGRRLFRRTGLILMISSWILLFAFAMFTFFKDYNESLFVKIAVSLSIISIVILFVITVLDRKKESKTDKYKDVIK